MPSSNSKAPTYILFITMQSDVHEWRNQVREDSTQSRPHHPIPLNLTPIQDHYAIQSFHLSLPPETTFTTSDNENLPVTSRPAHTYTKVAEFSEAAEYINKRARH